MLNNYTVLTVTHKTLELEDLSHFIIRHNEKSELRDKLYDIRERYRQEEIVYLSTCNRVIFIFYGQQEITKSDAVELFGDLNASLDKDSFVNIENSISLYQGREAILHLFEVASSLDSLVVGEREIFRQFREAYSFAKKYNLCGDYIRILEKAIVKAAKDVYTRTEIGARPVSVVSLAIQSFLKRNLNKESRILLVGAGETNSTVGRFLKKHGYDNIIIFNRTIDNALKLSQELDAQAMHLNELNNYSDSFSAIFACTNSQDPLVTSDLLDAIDGWRSEQKLFICDLAIPKNVASDVVENFDVDYESINHLRDLAEENLKVRTGYIEAAKNILSEHLSEFGDTFRRRMVEKAFGKLPKEIKKIKDRALTSVYKDQISSLPPETQTLISEITSYMEKKCVAVPMKLAKQELI